MSTEQANRPIVISGPSGSGKSTHLNRLLKEYPDRFGFSISHTTRQPRGQEQNGVEYHFVTKEDFLKLVDQNGFIEHAQFGSNHYGTSVQAVKDGVKQVKKKDLNARYLSIQPPSLEILEQRLRGRATDSEDAITQRLTQAKNELAFAKTPGVFDKVVINDDLEKAWKEFKAFCVSEE
ncbi:guanylate kinase [Aureobasidium sp. EXF-8846]|nr:guanylate kinase [Aureobasidium sp. EXF-8846]